MKPNLEVIQVFRGLAAAAVVLHHAADQITALPAVTAGTRIFLTARIINTDVGAAGVDLFFVISGFIMSYTVRRGGFDVAREFLARRAIRIYPLYWLCSLFAIAVLTSPWVQDFHPAPLALFQSFLLYPTLYENMVRPVVLGQGWTLIYEVLFYVLFALTLWQTRLRQLGAIFLALGGLFLTAQLFAGPQPVLVLLRDPVLFEFVLGLGLGLILTETPFRLGSRLRPLIFGLGLLLLALSAFPGGFGWEVSRLWRFGVPAFLLIGSGVLHPAAGSVRFPRGFAVLGDASYSIYLLHSVVFVVIHAAWLRVGWLQRLPLDGLFVLLAGTALAAGTVCHYAVEKPLLQFCRGEIALA